MTNKSDITIVNIKPGQEDEKGLDLYLKEESLREQAKNARELYNTIQDELEHREEDLKDGLSFLDMKNDTLLSYMIDVCNIVLRKVRGETIGGHQSVERCVEYRVILEKIKAVDQKLAYQLNKLITLPDSAEEEDQRMDVRNLDINLDNLETDAEDGDSADNHEDGSGDNSEEEDGEDGGDSSDDDVGKEDDSDEIDEDDRNVQVHKPQEPQRASVKGAAGVYKPPKLRSVVYTEEGEYMRGNKGRRKNYDDFYQDQDSGDIVEEFRRDKNDDRVKFEEENYTRLPDENPKKAKRKLKTKEFKKKGNNKFKRRR